MRARLQRLAELLTSSGYRASLADSQAEGFRLVQTSPVDFVLLRADLMDLQCCNAARGDQRVGGDGSHESFVVADRRTSGARAGIGFGRGRRDDRAVGYDGAARAGSDFAANETRRGVAGAAGTDRRRGTRNGADGATSRGRDGENDARMRFLWSEP